MLFARRMRSLFESIMMSLDSIRSNKLRSILTCLGIIIGVATVIGMMSIVEGIDGIVGKELNRIGASSFMLQKYPELSISMDWRKYHKRKDLTLEDVDAIQRGCPSVDLVSPTVSFGGKTISGGGEKTDPNVGLVGTTSVYPSIHGVDFSEGRCFIPLEDTKPRNVAILGQDVVDRLFHYGSPLGRYIRVDNMRLRVIGVLEKRGTVFGESQDNMVVIPMTVMAKHFNLRRRIEINIKARADAPIGRAIDEVRALMRVRHKLKANEEDDFEIETRDSITKAWTNLTGSIFAAAIGIAGISLLVGGIGIMNIMLVSVRERTREIGIRKALGARRKDISRQFLIEAGSLSLLGGLLGVAFGVGGLKLTMHYTDKVPIIITTYSIVLALTFSFFVGVFFGVYPARKAAKLDPIDALRYE